MFETEPDQSVLRQGDICCIEAFPLWSLDKARLVRDPAETLDGFLLTPQKQIVKTADGVLVAVCTQCCDLENPGLRIGVSIAPLRPVPVSQLKDPDRFAELEASYASKEDQFSFISLFPVVLPDSDELVVVDWSQAMSITPAKRAVEHLKALKCLQLTPPFRDHFRIKYSASVGRPPTE